MTSDLGFPEYPRLFRGDDERADDDNGLTPLFVSSVSAAYPDLQNHEHFHQGNIRVSVRMDEADASQGKIIVIDRVNAMFKLVVDFCLRNDAHERLLAADLPGCDPFDHGSQVAADHATNVPFTVVHVNGKYPFAVPASPLGDGIESQISTYADDNPSVGDVRIDDLRHPESWFGLTFTFHERSLELVERALRKGT